VYIIDEVHMLTREAFNALLKTLEEPPAHIIFVLATTEPHKVPITILSRVQRFDYQLANEADLTSKINRIAKQEGWKIDPDAARLIYEHSEGSYRDAESLLGKVFSSQGIGNKDVSVDMIRKLVGLPPQAQVEEMYEGLVTGNALKCLQVLESCRSQGYSLSQLLHHLVRHLRLQLYTLVEEGGDIRRETAVLGKLLQAQADLRQIDDAGVVLEMTVYSLISGDNTRIENEVTKVAKSNPVSRSSGLKEKLSGKRSSKVSVKEGRTKDGPWDRLLKAAKAKDFKLWTALKACSSKAEKSNLVIIAPYKAALSQLEESLENKDLVEIVDSVYGLKPKLRLELVKQLSASNENLVEGIL
jgi:DNA polymerase III gamma/tau subunit